MKGTADGLTILSRSFYERTRLKLAMSIVLGAASLMMLGFCSNSGGLAESHSMLRQDMINNNAGKDSIESKEALIAGYGFATFAYLCAFILLVAAAIYISPTICGTANERQTLKCPQEFTEFDNVGAAVYISPTVNG